MTAVWLLLIVPGLICLYAVILRPLLHRISALQKIYAEADGFGAKIWAICGKSTTLAWGYILGGIGSALALTDPISAAVGDPQLSDQIKQILQSRPEILGYVTIVISLVTVIARLRSISKVI